jgi:hypothetical protein
MKQCFYFAKAWFVIEVILLIFIGVFLYFGPEPAYLSWFEGVRMRNKHMFAYYAFMVLGVPLLVNFLFDTYRLISGKQVGFDKRGLYVDFTLKNHGWLPWENITTVDIQPGKYGIGIMAIYLDKPIGKKHVITIWPLGITRQDLNRLSIHYPRVEENNHLSLFRQ